MAQPIGGLMSSAWQEFGAPVDAVVPVPLHGARLRARGFNQSGLLAQVVGRELGIPGVDALVRLRATQPQSTLLFHERRRNVRETFAARERIGGKRILLVDDVLSTGFTASECAARLYGAGAAEVHVLVAALAVLERQPAGN
jgi:ComF family protein